MQSKANPESLLAFSQNLKRHTSRIQDRTSNIRIKVDQLAMLWQDERFREFHEVFAISMKDLKIFLDQADRQATFMRQKAELGMRFLRKK